MSTNDDRADARPSPQGPRRRRARGPRARRAAQGFTAWLRRAASSVLALAHRAALRTHRWFVRLDRRTQLRVGAAAVVVAVLAPLVALNLMVASFGRTRVFPLSPFFLREKLLALAAYGVHRPLCTFFGHPDTDLVVARAELRERLPRGLLAAVVKVESAGIAHRISPAGAMGPGQLMPDTARMLGVGDPFDTTENVDAAARLLAQHLVRFRNRIPLAVAAYNAGPGAVRGRVPNNGETPAYVAKVMRHYQALRPRRP